MYVEERKYVGGFVGKPKGNNHLEEIGADGRNGRIRNLILKK
jgi:hypothetical protein